MNERQLDENAARRLAIIRHAREVTGNVALTCRYYGISREVHTVWYRRYEAEGPAGLRDRSTRPGRTARMRHLRRWSRRSSTCGDPIYAAADPPAGYSPAPGLRRCVPTGTVRRCGC